MLRILVLIVGALFSTPTLAYCSSTMDKFTGSESLMECVEELRKHQQSAVNALDKTRTIAADSYAVFEYIDLEALRTEPNDIAEAGIAVRRLLADALAPERWMMDVVSKVDAFLPLRSQLAKPAALEAWYRVAKPKMMRLIDRSVVRGAIVKGGERLRPILEKPVSDDLARRGMEWRFRLLCDSPKVKAVKEECQKSPLPADFKAYYGVEMTAENIQVVGFLARRDLEGPGLAKMYQKIALELLSELSGS